ncbi:MAG: ABC transporter permease, partial [Candidatus Limnocylindrales bacterium]
MARAVTWSVGLWRLASGRIREDWRFLVGVWLLLACATTLLASGVLYGDAVAVGSLRAAVRAAPIAAQAILVETDLTPGQARADDPPVRASLSAALGGPGGEIMQEARSGSLLPIGQKRSTTAPVLTYLESATGASAHAALAAGRWAQPGHEPLEATVPESAARTLGLAVGDRLGLADAANPEADPNQAVATVVVVGTYRPDPTDPYWAGDLLDIAGQATISGASFRGPLLVDQADLLAAGRFSSLDVRWRAIPDLERLAADEIEPLRARLDSVSDQVRGLFPVGGSLTVTADLGRVLDTVDHSLQVARGAVLLLTLQFAVVAAYAVLLIAGMLADRRRPEVGLLRSRGASTAHVVGLAFGEALLLA